ncbi:TPA: hypothetical protein I9097_002268 [Clostridium perfringens]|nr:hypothetical protein [Clostridium perfringens]
MSTRYYFKLKEKIDYKLNKNYGEEIRQKVKSAMYVLEQRFEIAEKKGTHYYVDKKFNNIDGIIKFYNKNKDDYKIIDENDRVLTIDKFILELLNLKLERDYNNELDLLHLMAIELDYNSRCKGIEPDPEVVRKLEKNLGRICKNLNLDIHTQIDNYESSYSPAIYFRIRILRGLDIKSDSSKDGFESVVNKILEEIKRQKGEK